MLDDIEHARCGPPGQVEITGPQPLWARDGEAVRRLLDRGDQQVDESIPLQDGIEELQAQIQMRRVAQRLAYEVAVAHAKARIGRFQAPDLLERAFLHQRDRHPGMTTGLLDLYPVGEASLGKLRIVEMRIDVRAGDELEKAGPGEVHRLGDDDGGHGLVDQFHEGDVVIVAALAIVRAHHAHLVEARRPEQGDGGVVVGAHLDKQLSQAQRVARIGEELTQR